MINRIKLMTIASLTVFCAMGCKPDLVVEIKAPNTVVETQNIPEVEVVVTNTGTAAVLGTRDVGEKGYMVDIVLSKDKTVPVEWAIVPTPYEFKEDMLLKGGRISVTKTLQPNESATYTMTDILTVPMGLIPPDFNTGGAYLCAVADPGKVINEKNENNNTCGMLIKIVKP
ncbi:hypothetical protein KAW65_00015 [candidate division WOR-3 bacterium]|nr:hypothetical protein [candidate division WOR-3 bacterium]